MFSCTFKDRCHIDFSVHLCLFNFNAKLCYLFHLDSLLLRHMVLFQIKIKTLEKVRSVFRFIKWWSGTENGFDNGTTPVWERLKGFPTSVISCYLVRLHTMQLFHQVADEAYSSGFISPCSSQARRSQKKYKQWKVFPWKIGRRSISNSCVCLWMYQKQKLITTESEIQIGSSESPFSFFLTDNPENETNGLIYFSICLLIHLETFLRIFFLIL